MALLPKNIEKVIEEFNKLPGIGQKSAERLTFYLLKRTPERLKELGGNLENLKTGINYCENCQNLCTETVCYICNNPARSSESVCVVEEVLDLVALEKANQYKGQYHVLHGIISPMDGIGPDELKIIELIERIKKGGVKEVIFALNPSIEGEATANYIIRQIPSPETLKITRIANGIPMGGNLEYADTQTLKRAFEGRMNY